MYMQGENVIVQENSAQSAPLPRITSLIALDDDLLYVLGGSQRHLHSWLSVNHLWRYNFLTNSWKYLPLIVNDHSLLQQGMEDGNISYNIAHSKGCCGCDHGPNFFFYNHEADSAVINFFFLTKENNTFYPNERFTLEKMEIVDLDGTMDFVVFDHVPCSTMICTSMEVKIFLVASSFYGDSELLPFFLRKNSSNCEEWNSKDEFFIFQLSKKVATATKSSLSTDTTSSGQQWEWKCLNPKPFTLNSIAEAPIINLEYAQLKLANAMDTALADGLQIFVYKNCLLFSGKGMSANYCERTDLHAFSTGMLISFELSTATFSIIDLSPDPCNGFPLVRMADRVLCKNQICLLDGIEKMYNADGEQFEYVNNNHWTLSLEKYEWKKLLPRSTHFSNYSPIAVPKLCTVFAFGGEMMENGRKYLIQNQLEPMRRIQPAKLQILCMQIICAILKNSSNYQTEDFRFPDIIEVAKKLYRI